MVGILGYLWRLLATAAYTLGVAPVCRAIARALFAVPAMPEVPKIPGLLGHSRSAQAAFEAKCAAWAEVPFDAGAGQGFLLGFAAGVILMVLVLYRCNVITFGQKLGVKP